MKPYIAILIFFFCFHSTSYSQVNSKDSLKAKMILPSIGKLGEIQFTHYDSEFINNLSLPDAGIPVNKNSHTIWLWTFAAISNNRKDFIQPGSSLSYISSPLYHEFLENSKFNPVRYFLGMAQFTAAGYLAYKSIKKYGLWK